MSDGSGTFNLNFDLPSGHATGGDAAVRACLKHLRYSEPEKALEVLDNLNKDRGSVPLVRHLLALCICRLGRVVPAIRLLESAHEESPQAYEHVEVLASLLTIAGKRTEGVYYAKLSTALKPAYPEYELVPKWLIGFGAAMVVATENPIVENGYLLIKDGAFEKAAQDFVDAIDLDRTNVEAWQGLVDVSRLRQRPGESLRAAEALASLKEDDPDTLGILAQCRLDIGQIPEAWETINRALSIAGADPVIAHGLPALVRYDESAPPELSRQLSDAWSAMARFEPVDAPIRLRGSDDDRFRIGILSGSMQSGSERAALLSTIDESLGRAADLHYYSNSEIEDVVSRRLRRSAQRWRDIRKVDDDTVATIMLNDEIQILIDLDGYDWSGRPGVTARKPAPVVLCAFGEPGAVPGAESGVLALGEPWLPGFDEGADNAVTVKEGLSTWPLHVEPEEPTDEGKASLPPSMRILIDGTAGRLSPGFIDSVAEAVRLGMSSTVTIRGDNPEDALTTEILGERFRAAGLDLDKVVRVSRKTSLDKLLPETDILLDVTPVPSLDAALSALRLGVPVLSQTPRRPENGAVASLLSSFGLSDWVTADAQSFSERLAQLSKDVPALRKARGDIRAAVRDASSLDARLRRGRAFVELFDRLLAAAKESA